MTAEIKVSEKIVSCSDNGQHPLVYINLKSGKGRCHYCGKTYINASNQAENTTKAAA
ncbi:MAG: zinc-finger domain-containing protein [Mariprofundaceae bacterium]